MTRDLIIKEIQLEQDLKILHKRENAMEGQRAKIEEDKLRLLKQFHDQQQKLEQEIERRLFFEQKLNSLHSLNMNYEMQIRL